MFLCPLTLLVHYNGVKCLFVWFRVSETMFRQFLFLTYIWHQHLRLDPKGWHGTERGPGDSETRPKKKWLSVSVGVTLKVLVVSFRRTLSYRYPRNHLEELFTQGSSLGPPSEERVMSFCPQSLKKTNSRSIFKIRNIRFFVLPTIKHLRTYCSLSWLKVFKKDLKFFHFRWESSTRYTFVGLNRTPNINLLETNSSFRLYDRVPT